MKTFNSLTPNKKPDKAQWRRPPTMVAITPEEISRIVPKYIADNFDYFSSLPLPKYKTKNIDKYVLRIKEKITCFMNQF